MDAIRVHGFENIDDDKICYWKDKLFWWFHYPKCGSTVLQDHQVAEHKDGTISVTPAIVMRGVHNGRPITVEGSLEHGVWKTYE